MQRNYSYDRTSIPRYARRLSQTVRPFACPTGYSERGGWPAIDLAQPGIDDICEFMAEATRRPYRLGEPPRSALSAFRVESRAVG